MSSKNNESYVTWPEGRPLEWEIVRRDKAKTAAWREQAKKLHAEGRSVREIAAAVGKGKSEVQRVVSGARD